MAAFFKTVPLIITRIDDSSYPRLSFYAVGEVVEANMRSDATLPMEALSAPSAMGPTGSARCEIENVARFGAHHSWVYFLRHCVKESRRVDEKLIALERDVHASVRSNRAEAIQVRKSVRWPSGQADIEVQFPLAGEPFGWMVKCVQFSQVSESYEYHIDLVTLRLSISQYGVAEGNLEIE